MAKGKYRWALVAGAVGIVGLGALGAGTSSAGGDSATISATSNSTTPGDAAPGDEASKEKDVPDLLANGEALFVDVRTPREFAQNGLQGAINIPVQEMTMRIGEFGDPDQPVVIYCRTGSRSSHAKRILEQYGYEKVHDLGAHWTAQRVVREAQQR